MLESEFMRGNMLTWASALALVCVLGGNVDSDGVLGRRTMGAEPIVFVSLFARATKRDSGVSGGWGDWPFESAGKNHRGGHPFFLGFLPDQKFLYSIHAKQFGGKEDEEVAAYAVEGRTGNLKLLNRQLHGGRRLVTAGGRDRQSGAAGELSYGERSVLSHSSGWFAGTSRDVCPARGQEHRPGSTTGAARPLLCDQS